MKKHIFKIFLIGWLVFIFYLSNKDFYITNDLSMSITKVLIHITNFLNLTDISEEYMDIAIIIFNHPLRKIAHIIEYFILALIIFNFFKTRNLKNKKYFLTFILCFIYALFDEYHQTFIDGRNGQFGDCLIDMFGCVFYLSLVHRTTKSKKK